ncbi:MAG: methyltransferase domain-containing protein [Geobacteraceae bacterium]|nr:methyltransferase domain-containing protein [Geobacteraceae bacterium]
MIKNKTSNSLRGAVPLSHLFLRERVRPGDRVVDATCGNGHDTLLLAQLVGPEGRVWAFDVQEEALTATRELLSGEGLSGRVELLRAGHERLAEFVREELRAVVFNLGFLPGGDREFVTRPEHTVAALEQAAGLILAGGIITVCIYTGHPGGPEEGEAVARWGAGLSPKRFNVWSSRQLNRPATAPYLVLVEKSG